MFAVNSNGKRVDIWSNEPILADKIVVNHYYIKSKEEYIKKVSRGAADANNYYDVKNFNKFDRNEVFDDSILKYRTARAENFSFESDGQRANRVINSLVQILTQNSSEVPAEFFKGKLETFLACRAVAEKLHLLGFIEHWLKPIR